MALSFYPIYSGGSKNGRFSYLLASRQTVDPSKPWTGIYIASDQNLGPGLAKSTTINDLFQQFAGGPSLINTLIFLYFAADAAANVTAIGGALDGIDWRPGTLKNQGTIIWVAAPRAIAQAAIDAAPRLPYSISGGRVNRAPFANSPGQQPLLSLAPGATGSQSLFISGGATVPLSATANNDGLLLGGGGLGIARGTSSADQQPVIATIAQIAIPAGDANNGCLGFTGSFAGTGTFSFPGTLPLPTSGLGVGFQYGITVDGSSTSPTSGPVSYPLLDTPGSLQGWPTSVVLSILDNKETFFSLQPSGSNTVRSAFRTLLDGTILLTPQSDGSSQLVFNVGYGNAIYLTPQGAFTHGGRRRQRGSDTEPSGLGNQLLCGLSGVEYISFVPGDLLWFYPDKPAGIIAELDSDLPKPANVALAFDATTPPKLTTAYAMVLPVPASKADGRAYYSEPDQAPFFTKPKQSADSNALDLSYYALSIAQLPKALGPSETYVPFPLLP